MRTRIVKIGNSEGIRIPKPLLEETGLSGEVELTVEGARLILSPIQNPRDGWDEAFAATASQGGDSLLDADSLPPTDWEESWVWCSISSEPSTPAAWSNDWGSSTQALPRRCSECWRRCSRPEGPPRRRDRGPRPLP